MRAILAVAVLSLLPQVARAQTNLATPPVRLQYRWPGGIEASVEVRKLRTRGEAGTDTVFSSMDYRMRTRPFEGGLLVSYDSFTVAGLPEDMPAEATQEIFGALLPDYAVSREGAFVRVVGMEAMKEMIDAMISENASGAANNPEVKALLDQATSVETLSAIIAAEWDGMVSTWIDGELTKNEVLELQVEEAVAMMPSVMLPMQYEFELLDRVPCHEGETIKRCVELERRSFPDPEAFKQVVTAMMESAGANEAGSYLESMTLENRVRVVTDPNRLLPYAVTFSKEVSGSGREKGVPRSFASVEVKSYRFTYKHEQAR